MSDHRPVFSQFLLKFQMTDLDHDKQGSEDNSNVNFAENQSKEEFKMYILQKIEANKELGNIKTKACVLF